MKLWKIIKLIMITGGSALIAYSIIISGANRFGLENAALIIIGAASVAYALFWRRISPHTVRGVPRVLKYIFFVGVVIFAVSFAASLIAMSAASNKKCGPGADAIIVLGCGLRGRNISLTLGARLNKAYEYAMDNPGAVIVTAGGQGPGEDVTEAFAMREYLIGKGIDGNRILMEDASTNTKENMLLSKIVLDSHFDGNAYNTVIVTSNFHMLRSLEYAGIMELNAQGLSSKCPYYLMPVYLMREYMALIKLYVFRI